MSKTITRKQHDINRELDPEQAALPDPVKESGKIEDGLACSQYQGQPAHGDLHAQCGNEGIDPQLGDEQTIDQPDQQGSDQPQQDRQRRREDPGPSAARPATTPVKARVEPTERSKPTGDQQDHHPDRNCSFDR